MHPSLIYRYAPGSTSVASTHEVRAWIRDEYRERSPRRVSGMLIAGWDPVWLLSSDRGKYAPTPHRVALAAWPYAQCADCGEPDIHVSRLGDGLCPGCAAADAAEGRHPVWAEWDRKYREWSDNDSAATGYRY